MQAEGRAPVLGRKAVILAGIAVTLACIDQATKALARSSLESGSKQIISGWIELSLTKNTGAAFGILPGGRALFLVGAAALIIGVAVGIKRVEKTTTAVALGLLVGGAAGNAIDRIFAPGGSVTDFIDFRWWPAFNIADVAIVCGAALIAIGIWQRPGTAEADEG